MSEVDTVRLGDLKIDRRVWVRRSVPIDHVRCMVRDLQNGAVLPPLLVERATLTVIGGNSRYNAYRFYYGDNWKDARVTTRWIDLPPFTDDPVAWWRAALDDNGHLAERLQYTDRNGVAADIARSLPGPLSDEGRRIARLLHHTDESWAEFCKTYVKALEVRDRRTEGEQSPAAPRSEPQAPPAALTPGAKAHVPPKPGLPGGVAPTNDFTPGHIVRDSITPVARLLSLVRQILNVMQGIELTDLTVSQRRELEHLRSAVDGLLREKAG